MEQEQFKRTDKVMHIAEAFYTNKVVAPLLPSIGQTFITPNMVTIFNICLSFVIFYLAYEKYYVLVALLIQLYLFLDILDGNLARYKNMKSELGAKLDTFCDTFFYNFIFIFLGIHVVEWYLIAAVVALINLYGLIATHYIVPRLRKIKTIKRTGIKKWFLDRGYLIGMDLGTIDILSTLFLLAGNVKMLYLVIIIGNVGDIFFRLYELKKNEELAKLDF
jgi:archaetidylinositol phosphate synthase